MAKNEAVVVGLTEDRVREMIAEATRELVTENRVNTLVAQGYEGTVKLIAEAIKVIPNEDRIREMIAEFPQPSFMTTLAALGTEEEKPSLDPDWLEGLTFCGSKLPEQVKGQPRQAFVPFERPLTEEDILSFTVGEAAVTLITADGQKYTVEI